ncbi:MtrAB system histidine kinase MtrB [Georgenia sp. 10Sc9-8]|uniref:Sensor histidine kinase MtrB n=1 Tax=Georgenia halotolerans TaxID=3028317 RepID=A0ABT5TZI4_9MICO|nr:MtrAB system histidine kinase MtrB [Georgenia halotolerans]
MSETDVPSSSAVADTAGYPPRRRPSLRVRLRSKLLGLGWRWRSSLSLRTASITMIGGAVALSLLGWYVSSQIRDGLFEERVEQVLADAAWRAEEAQSNFNASTAQTSAQVQQLAVDQVEDLQDPTSGAVGTTLLRSPYETSQLTIVEPSSGTGVSVRPLVTEEIQEALATEGGQHWQPVAIPSSDGDEPGIIVGSPVNLPAAGAHELYIAYTLAPEEETVSLVMRVLAIGAGVLVIVLAAMAWVITWRVLRPVTQAAATAERIADGLLHERMTVRGHDELATLGRSFNEMASSLEHQIERLEELSRLQQRFVSDVSHELRTPLTTIRMAGELLHDYREEFPASVRRAAELLHTQLDRFESMLADLLEISRFDAGAAVLEAEERDLRNVVANVVEMAAPLAAARGSDLVVHAPDTPCTAQIDPRRIERVLRNLVINAVEHGAGAPVDITVGVEEEAVAVRVRDHGVGMSPEDAARVFDRFWRADPARARTTGGTGLGLAISLEDARLHSGWLEAWGEEGVGAAFRLTLPRRADVELASSPLSLEDDRPATTPQVLEGGPGSLVGLAPGEGE